jgi:hypothetical protein
MARTRQRKSRKISLANYDCASGHLTVNRMTSYDSRSSPHQSRKRSSILGTTGGEMMERFLIDRSEQTLNFPRLKGVGDASQRKTRFLFSGAFPFAC